MLCIKMLELVAGDSANPLDFSELDAGPTIHPFTSGHLNAGGRSSTGTSLTRLEAPPVLGYYELTDGATAQATPRGDGPPGPSPSTWNYTPGELHTVKTWVR